MSDAEAQNDKQPHKKEPGPTASFDSLVLGPGSQIGQFRIERELGRGGMGVVYLAHDTKLDRSVAIKSLPAQVVGNRQVLSRWEREARLLASLNHPNIATIHEVHEEPESASYLVLEYIPGQTLADRLKAGSMPLDEALSVFGQIAEGLEAAHQAGIIHRDLKPANVKIIEDGRVKILDFGIAKEIGGKASDKDSTVTQPGKIIGTPAYMSPEQARGQPADKRTDIWAFGCCFYESLTGKCAFEGATDSDALAKVLEREPDWNALPKKTPMRIRRLLFRCLEKDPRRRLRDIGEAWFEISETQSGTSEAFALSGDAAAVSRLSRRHVILLSLAFLAVGVLLTSALFKSFTRPTPPAQLTVSRLIIDEPPDHRFSLGSTPHCPLALSPDGSRLVYKELTGYLCLRSLDSLDTERIPGTERAMNPFFSPDGQWVGFFTSEQLKKVSFAGGGPVTLLDDLLWAGATTASWGEDGTIIFDAGPGIQRISADGGAPEIVIEPGPGESPFQYPQILPGGDVVLFTTGSQIEIVRLKTKQRQIVLRNATCARYVKSGHLAFIRNTSVFIVSFDLKQLSVTGAAFPINERVRLDWGGNMAQMAVSQNGTLVYALELAGSSEKTLVWVDHSGQSEPLGAPARNYRLPRLSPDGQKVVVTIMNESRESREHQVLLYDIARGALTQLTTEGSNLSGLFSPDGRFAVYRSDRAEKSCLYRKALDGSIPDELLASECDLVPTSWSPDNRYIACITATLETQDDIWIVPLDGQGEARPFIATVAREFMPAFSPDGSWIAYTSQQSGVSQVYLREFPDNGRTIQVSTDAGSAPRWSPDGSKLFYGFRDKMMAVSVTMGPPLTLGKPEPLFKSSHYKGDNYGHDYDVSLDGQQFLMIEESGERKNKLVVVQNWFEELKRLAPPGKNQ
ncbi:MAG: protein kinase [Planctomycetes bacterium]|nr:protein kinase [Planctomycetota bacterium]